MSMEKPLVNRVANSGIKVINLEDHYPAREIIDFDLKEYLFKGLILKEKDFRKSLKELDWSEYDGKIVLVHNTTDAIIPVWAYMLVSAYLQGHAHAIFQGNRDEYLKFHYSKLIEKMDLTEYQEDRVVIKGCSNKPVPPSAYAQITAKLKPFAQSIMYGEPCSTVPIFKRPRDLSLRKKT